jgi:hypothetical protein
MTLLTQYKSQVKTYVKVATAGAESVRDRLRRQSGLENDR